MAKSPEYMRRYRASKASAMGAGGKKIVIDGNGNEIDLSKDGWWRDTVSMPDDLPKLQGTEKQVQYANDIRETMRNTIDRLNAITDDSDRNDIAAAGADISTIARQLGLDIGDIREDLKSDRETAYKNLLASGLTSQQARKEAYKVDRESAFALSAKQSASIKESGGTREERDNARKEARVANIRKAASAIRKAASNAFRNQTEAEWWIDRK